MNARRHVLALAAAMACGLAWPAPAKKRQRIYMILYRGESALEQGFRRYFSANGIDVDFIVRNVAMDLAKVPGLVREARLLGVDLVYTSGTALTQAVAGLADSIDRRRHLTDIPLVFAIADDPVAAGLAGPHQTSGRNITGTSHQVPITRQLDAMLAYRRFAHIAILYNAADPVASDNARALREATRSAGIALVERTVPLDEAGNPIAGAIGEQVAALARQRAPLLYIGNDALLVGQRHAITDAAIAGGLPVFSPSETMLRDGNALFGLVASLDQVGRLAAYKAALILQRERAPNTIPIETLVRFSYLVNLDVAKQIQLFPPMKVIDVAEVLR
ncbi:MAG: ABC transporter substrate-binding protein [Pseudomonadota bacterium]